VEKRSRVRSVSALDSGKARLCSLQPRSHPGPLTWALPAAPFGHRALAPPILPSKSHHRLEPRVPAQGGGSRCLTRSPPPGFHSLRCIVTAMSQPGGGNPASLKSVWWTTRSSCGLTSTPEVGGCAPDAVGGAGGAEVLGPGDSMPEILNRFTETV
jgi:hypothetical protein